MSGEPGEILRPKPKSQTTPTQGLALPSQEESIETPIIPLYTPLEQSGYTDVNRKIVREKKEPTEEELKEFFTPENIQRLIYCPQINIDELDGWGMFGYEPGYIFINKRHYEGIRNLNDQLMFEGKRGDTKSTRSGHKILTISHYDHFPQGKFAKQLLTLSRTPKTFAFLRKLLDNVDPEDLSTYPTEDLDNRLKLIKRSLPDESSLKEARGHRIAAQEAIERGESERGKTLLEWAEIVEGSYTNAHNQVPKTVKDYLGILEEASRRPEIKNPGLLRLAASLPEQEKIIEDAIRQAREEGDQYLAQQIEALHKKTSLYTRNNLFLPGQEDIKAIGQ